MTFAGPNFNFRPSAMKHIRPNHLNFDCNPLIKYRIDFSEHLKIVPLYFGAQPIH